MSLLLFYSSELNNKSIVSVFNETIMGTTAMAHRTHHTGIVVSDMEKALTFYQDLLGMSKIFDSAVGGTQVEHVVGLEKVNIRIAMIELDDGTRIELLQYLSHPRPAPVRVESCDIGCSHVALEVDDVDVVCQRLSAAGLSINHPPEVDDRSYVKAAYVHDFDGTIVELIEILDESKCPF